MNDDLANKIKIIPELEELGVPYRFTKYDVKERDIDNIASSMGIKPDQIIKTLLVRSKNNNYLILLPTTKKVDWPKLRKFIGEKDLKVVPKDEVKKITGFEAGTVPPLLENIRRFGDMNIMKNQFLTFGTGVKGVAMVLDKNDIVNRFQVTLGYFTKQ